MLTASIAHEGKPTTSWHGDQCGDLSARSGFESPKSRYRKDTARRAIRDANRAADVIARLWNLFSRKPPHLEAVDINEIAESYDIER